MKKRVQEINVSLKIQSQKDTETTFLLQKSMV